jgi:hypothetical protein
MRILYDHQVFSLQDAGGASRYHFELVRNLQVRMGSNWRSSLPEVRGDAAFYFEASGADQLSAGLVATLRDSQGLARKRQMGRSFTTDAEACTTIWTYTARC